ncbi:hypothetical protein P7C71_g4759, partial [Lecanoromycetidae sp. Uapishka_2]
MRIATNLLTLLLPVLASSTLLVDYTAPADTSVLGTCQLEAAELHDTVPCPGNANVYIKPGQDTSGKAALHYHREAGFRRAEVKAAGTYTAGKHYYAGYEFTLGNVHEHLAIFQWKNGLASAQSGGDQDIVFNLQFTESLPTRLSLGYTPPGGDDYETIWTDSSGFSTTTTHNIALAWDTLPGGNNNVQLWLDGQKVFEKGGLSLWSGDVYPKFGIYRGEKGDHDTPGESNVFDLWVYKVQISDASLDEVSGASGLGAGVSADVVGGGGPLVPTATGSDLPAASGLTTSYTATTSSQKPLKMHFFRSG